ncbi:MAG: protein translocase subunit SecF [Vampirovibrionales bacterium]|nr:protein translocase subunit SecF [Vampirovibrionales bacterium]
MAASSDTLSQPKSQKAQDKTLNTPNTGPLKPGVLDIVRDRWLYLGFSLLLLVPGLFFIVTNWLNPEIKAPVRLGIDFSGGTMLEYGFHNQVTENDLPKIKAIFEEKGYRGTVVQIQKPRAGINDTETIETRKSETAANTAAPANLETKAKAAPDAKSTQNQPPENLTLETTTNPIGPATQTPSVSEGAGKVSTIVYIRSKQLSGADQQAIHQELGQKLGDNTLLQNYSIGPSLATELLQNGLLALGLAYLLIVGYLTFRFEFDYALCAIVSLVHDALFVFGVFAILGHFFNTEIDSMFITALLTVVGFSVHDTIVVFDRLRENSKVYFTKKLPFSTIANLSVNQTLVRSISTSVTVLLTLLALYLFGGETTKDFIFACLIGIAAGTYSSIFVASALIAWVRERKEQRNVKASA